MYEGMRYIRMVEEAIADHYQEQEMRCPIHLSIGQEATAVGVCQSLSRSDLVFSTHRCHAHYLAKGGNLKRMIAEIYGKSSGCIGGRGGSMHLADHEVGLVASVPIVSSSIPLAVGTALSDKIDGTSRVSVAFFGDAATEEGVFHESLNLAQLYELPVLFVCENNLFSVYTDIKERQPNRPISDLAKAHGVVALEGDGNDIDEVCSLTKSGLTVINESKRPVLLTLHTYRWREHCGPNYDNQLGYRTEEDFLWWKGKDPIANLEKILLANGMLDDEKIVSIEKIIMTKIRDAFEFAKFSPLPDSSLSAQYVYS